ncbi:hypothetical protein Tco_1446819 [Tanacetum coccineum]
MTTLHVFSHMEVVEGSLKLQGIDDLVVQGNRDQIKVGKQEEFLELFFSAEDDSSQTGEERSISTAGKKNDTVVKKFIPAKRKKSIPKKTTRKRQKLEDVEKDELKGFLDVVPREEIPIEIESLSTKFPIVDWKTVVLTETFMYYQQWTGDPYVDRKEVSLESRDAVKDVEYKIGGRP